MLLLTHMLNEIGQVGTISLVSNDKSTVSTLNLTSQCIYVCTISEITIHLRSLQYDFVHKDRNVSSDVVEVNCHSL
jgi:hypothetical protein